jgi:hypothetical protein
MKRSGWTSSIANRFAHFAFAIGLSFASSAAWSDACTDLSAAIVKALVLQNAMQREATQPLSPSKITMPAVSACAATQSFRDHIIVVANQINSKCLSEDAQRELAIRLNAGFTEATTNVGLFCR